MINNIYISRRLKYFIPEGTERLDLKYIAAIQANIASLGFTLSDELAERLSTLPLSQLSPIYAELVRDLLKMVGACKTFAPLFPNFPKQVVETNLSDLRFFNSLHYLGDWIGARILPVFNKKERPPLTETIELKSIGLGSEEDFLAMFKGLIASKTSVSTGDKEDLTSFITSRLYALDHYLPSDIPHKENLAFVSGLIFSSTPDAFDRLRPFYRGATDVLRFATALSGGDTSLAANTKFRSLKRSERKFVLSLLESIATPDEDMFRHAEKWIRLGERLHPGDYKEKFKNSYRAFHCVRNGIRPATFNSVIESGIKSPTPESLDRVTTHLSQRPGEYARRLRHLLSLNEKFKSSAQDNVIYKFAAVADKVSVPVLLQAYTYFKSGRETVPLRVFFPKLQVSKAYARENDLIPIKPTTSEAITSVLKTALIDRFAALSSLGACFLDDNLQNFTVPLSLRSASKALQSVARGSKFDLDIESTLRFFLWWKEGLVNGK
jgi:hypothetical protein